MPDSPGRLHARVRQVQEDVRRVKSRLDAVKLTLKRLGASKTYAAQVKAAQDELKRLAVKKASLAKDRRNLDIAMERHAVARQKYIKLDANVTRETSERERCHIRLVEVQASLEAKVAKYRTSLYSPQTTLKQVGD